MISHQALEVRVIDQLICSFICSLIHSLVHLTDITEHLWVPGPIVGAGDTAVNETGVQWGKETTDTQNTRINKLLKSSSAVPTQNRVRRQAAESWSTVERWRERRAQGPGPAQRAQRQPQAGSVQGEPGYGVFWRDGQAPAGGSGKRSRGPGITPPGVQRCRALAKSHSITGTAARQQTQEWAEAGREQPGGCCAGPSE